MAINQIDIATSRKKVRDVIERTRKQNVIRIQPAHDVAGRFREAKVQGMRLSPVLSDSYCGDSIFKPTQNRVTFVT